MNNLKYSNTVLVNLIIASIIPFLIWGPFFPDLIISVSALFFLYYVFKNKNFNYFLNKPLIIFFIFCIYCILISIFVAEDMMLSLESSLFYFRIGVFSCFIWYLINKDKSILIYFYYALILCFSILVIDGYFQYFTGVNLMGFKITGVRVASFLTGGFLTNNVMQQRIGSELHGYIHLADWYPTLSLLAGTFLKLFILITVPPNIY